MWASALVKNKWEAQTSLRDFALIPKLLLTKGSQHRLGKEQEIGEGPFWELRHAGNYQLPQQKRYETQPVSPKPSLI